MINFSAMHGALSTRLRILARLIPHRWCLPVLQGPLRGARWVAGSSDAGYWLGSYEADVQLVLTRLVKPGAVVYDVGANVGFFSLLAARLAGPNGRVYAFEPVPSSAALLRRHAAMNDARTIMVIEAAANDRSGPLRIAGEGSKSQLVSEGDLQCDGICTDDLWRKGELELPSVVKIDVEGSELAVLHGMDAVLDAGRPDLVIEFHGARRDGQDVDTLAMAFLTAKGYTFRRLPSGHYHAAPEVPIGSTDQFGRYEHSV